MDYEKDIGVQQRIALELEADRRELLQQIPFGKELERFPHDPARIARPVVAVAGAFSAGKSALLNALIGTNRLPTGVTPTTLVPVFLQGGEEARCSIGTRDGLEARPLEQLKGLITDKDSPARYVLVELPELQTTPWQWLDAPGTNTDAQKKPDIQLRPRDLTDICILATSALQPLSLTDMAQLARLGEDFEDDSLCVVLTRSDLLSQEELASTLQYTRKMLADVLPGRSLKLFAVSSRNGQGLAELRTHLATTVYTLQKKRLDAALGHWSSLLNELKDLLGMRELARMRPETIQRIRVQLDELIVASSLQLQNELPRFMAQAEQQLLHRLPLPKHQASSTFNAQMMAFINPRVDALKKRIQMELTRELQKDLSQATSVTLSNRFLLLLPPTAPFMDLSTDLTKMGVGTGALLGASAGPAGILLGSLIGGILGGMVGNASTFDTPHELREQLALPFTRTVQGRLRLAIDSSRREVTHLCRLMDQVTDIFSRPEAGTYDIQSMGRLLKLADARHGSLNERFKSVELKRQQQALASLVKKTSAPSPRSPPASKVSTRSRPKSGNKRG